MALCKYCLVCTKPCNDKCEDYALNKDFEFLELKWEVEDNVSDKFKNEPSYKEKLLSIFSDEELEAEINRRKHEE